MACYPKAAWRPVGNFGYPRGTHGQLEVVAIVDHIAQGTMVGIDAWFANPTSKASAHFAVSKLGQVHQYVDLEDAAWANGKKDRPDNTIPWMTVTNPNLVTISIEHEGFTGETWPEAMYAADLSLHRWLVGTFGIPVDDDHIIGHCRIDSVNRAGCPGTGWPQARLFRDLEGDDMEPELGKVSPPSATDLKELPGEFAGKWPIWTIGVFIRYGFALLRRRDNLIGANKAAADAKIAALGARVKTLERLKNPCNFGTDHATVGERMGQYRTAIKALQTELMALQAVVDAHMGETCNGRTPEEIAASLEIVAR